MYFSFCAHLVRSKTKTTTAPTSPSLEVSMAILIGTKCDGVSFGHSTTDSCPYLSSLPTPRYLIITHKEICGNMFLFPFLMNIFNGIPFHCNKSSSLSGHTKLILGNRCLKHYGV